METEASYAGVGGEQEGPGGSADGGVTGEVGSSCPALPRLGLCPRCFVFLIPLLLTTGPHQRRHPAHLTEVGPEAQRAEETYPGQGGNMDCPSPGVRPQSPAPSPVWEPQPCLEKASPEGVQQLLGCVSGQEGHSGA